MNIKKRVILVMICFTTISLFQNCNGDQKTTSEENSGSDLNAPNIMSGISPSCFMMNPTPLMKSGDYFSGSNWNDPHVLKVGKQYWMYASSGTGNGEVAIYRFITSDLTSAWKLSPKTPVFTKGAGPTDWDSQAVETPSVVSFKNKYYLFYTGYTNQSDVKTYKIGYATSTDGINWTRAPNVYLAPTDPNGSPNNQFNQYAVAEPGAVVFNNKIYVYFSAVGANSSVQTTLQTIGLITTSDGVSWSSVQQVLLPDQSIYPRSQHWTGYSTPHAAVINSQMHLFFDVANDALSWTQLRLHHAVSTDGINAWIQDQSATLGTSQFNWASREVRAPAVFLEGSSLHYWFGADQGSILSIGKGRCNL